MSQTASATRSNAAPSSVLTSGGNDIVQSIGATGSTTLAKTLLLPNYITLRQLFSTSKVTLFLPSEAAVQQAISDGSLNLTITQNTINVLTYHLIAGIHPTNTFNATQFQSSFLRNHTSVKQGNRFQVLGVSLEGSTLQVTNGVVSANVITPDIQCKNGIIHVIDTVLVPPKNAPTTITQIPELATYSNITQNYNLTGVLSSQQATIFAPNNGAWNQLGYFTQPEDIILRDVKYGVVRGVYRSTDLQPGALISITGQVVKVDRVDGNITINGAQIVHADILTSAGVVHVIDSVMDPTESSAAIDASFSSHSKSMASIMIIAQQWTAVAIAAIIMFIGS
ncbi:FAS1 domain-containing protein [Umbelopsis sp. AD052]|nr:FAS1 domain-containing protein [Umbelopsis sp. AD052]